MNKTKLLITTLISLTLLSSCGPKDYTKSNLIGAEDFFASKETKYGVYYFKTECPSCEETLPFVNDYLAKLEKNKDKYDLKNIYFIDAEITPLNLFDKEQGYEVFLQSQIGVTSLQGVYQIGYPLLYIVEKVDNVNTIIDVKIGGRATRDYIKSIW